MAPERADLSALSMGLAETFTVLYCMPALNVLSCETAQTTWNQGRSRICGVYSRRLSGQIVHVL